MKLEDKHALPLKLHLHRPAFKTMGACRFGLVAGILRVLKSHLNGDHGTMHAWWEMVNSKVYPIVSGDPRKRIGITDREINRVSISQSFARWDSRFQDPRPDRIPTPGDAPYDSNRVTQFGLFFLSSILNDHANNWNKTIYKAVFNDQLKAGLTFFIYHASCTPYTLCSIWSLSVCTPAPLAVRACSILVHRIYM